MLSRFHVEVRHADPAQCFSGTVTVRETRGYYGPCYYATADGLEAGPEQPYELLAIHRLFQGRRVREIRVLT